MHFLNSGYNVLNTILFVFVATPAQKNIRLLGAIYDLKCIWCPMHQRRKQPNRVEKINNIHGWMSWRSIFFFFLLPLVGKLPTQPMALESMKSTLTLFLGEEGRGSGKSARAHYHGFRERQKEKEHKAALQHTLALLCYVHRTLKTVLMLTWPDITGNLPANNVKAPHSHSIKGPQLILSFF